MNMRKTRDKVFAIFIAALMLLGVCMPTVTSEVDAASAVVTYKGATYSYNSDGSKPSTGNKHSMFGTNFGGGIAYCGQHGIPTPVNESKGSTATIPMSVYNDSTMAKVLFYGWGGPEQWSGFSSSAYNSVYGANMFSGNDAKNGTEACGLTITAMATSRAYGHKYSSVCGFDAFWSYISSKSVPKGFTVYKLSDGKSGTQDLFAWEYNPNIDVKVTVNKVSANKAISDDNNCYSLAGAQYKVTCGGEATTITTNANGVATKTITVSPDDAENILIQETKASPGYALDTQVYRKDGSGGSVTITSREVPANDPMGLVAQKKDAETGKAYALGNARIENAFFQIDYFDGMYNSETELEDKTPLRSWVVKTDQKGRAFFDEEWITNDSDELYYSSDGFPTIPVGTVKIYEIEPAPTGYKLNTDVSIQQVTSDGTLETVETLHEIEVPEQVKRGDLAFVKVAEKTMDRLVGVPFLLTSKTTGESHVLVTDDNGQISTENSFNRHSSNTNKNDEAYDAASGTVDETKLDASYGVWFGRDNEGNTAPVNDNLGALPFDTYILDELPCSVNENYTLVKNIEVKVTRDGRIVNIGTVVDSAVKLSTSARDKELDREKTLARDNLTIEDSVKYEGVEQDKTYIMKMSFADKETGDAITADGEEVTSQKRFTAKNEKGSLTMEATFDASDLAGKQIVVFEELLSEDGSLVIASHTDLDDRDQTITFVDPKIGTTAIDSETGTNYSYADNSVTINDSVEITGLLGGYEYALTGTVMDKATGKPLMVNGNKVTASKKFFTNRGNENIEMQFNFDASDLAGKDVVVFETITFDGLVVASHKDINDEGQTIHFPEIKTTATDSDTLGHMSLADENVTIKDTVSYKNVKAGASHVLQGKLIDKSTGAVIASDRVPFTPESKNGTHEVTFTFDGTKYAGKTTVVFETLSWNGITVATHNDLNDVKQTVRLPKVETSAKDSDTEGRISLADGTVTVIDTVDYTNVLVGETYTAKGQLIAKDTDEVIATAEKEFVADAANGSVDVIFTFNGIDYSGKDVVVYETLEWNSKVVGNHKDPSDEKQTIHLPKVTTSAADSENKGHMSLAGDKVVTVDTVSYYNVIVGEKYEVTGQLLDKETQEVIAEDTVSFTAKEKNGEVDVTFEYDGTDLAGKDVVVYETLTWGDKVIGKHTDLDDAEQTIHLPKIQTSAKDDETGCHMSYANGKVFITDTVDYENLMVGEEYTVEGQFIDAETEKPITNGDKEVKGSTTFTAEEANGSIEVKFEFDASDLAGKDIVVYETLKWKSFVIGEHKEPQDHDQTISFPKIGTKAFFKGTDENVIEPGKDLTVVDHISYENIRLDDVVASEDMPEGLNEVILQIFRASLDGEELTAEQAQDLIEKKVSKEELDAWLERVDLDNIEEMSQNVLSQSFVVEGVLMDKSTGKPYIENGHQVKSVGAYKIDKESGILTLEFPEIDGSKLNGKSFVVYETLYFNGAPIASHKDINDDAQTVTIQSPPATPQTGQNLPWILVGLFAVIAMAGIYVFINRKHLFEKK